MASTVIVYDKKWGSKRIDEMFKDFQKVLDTSENYERSISQEASQYENARNNMLHMIFDE